LLQSGEGTFAPENKSEQKMKKVILATAFLVLSTVTFAENSKTKAEPKAKAEATVVAPTLSLSGNVIDQVSGEALVGVEVKIEGTENKTYTDFDGHFVFDNLKPGSCKLITSYTSYNKIEKSLTVSSKNNQVKIELKASN